MKISNKIVYVCNVLLFIQAAMFKETILKIEGDNVSAAECSNYLECLKGDIMLRKDEKFVDVATENEMMAIIKSGKSDQKTMEDIFCTFYGK